MRFKVGDKIRIKSNLVVGNRYNGECLFNSDMKEYKGRMATIREIHEDRYILDIDEPHWHWCEEMVERYTEFKIGDKVEVTWRDNGILEEKGEVISFYGGDLVIEFDDWRNGWGLNGNKWYVDPKYIKLIKEEEEMKYSDKDLLILALEKLGMTEEQLIKENEEKKLHLDKKDLEILEDVAYKFSKHCNDDRSCISNCKYFCSNARPCEMTFLMEYLKVNGLLKED